MTWQQDCVRYEQGGTREFLKAALQYEKQAEKGWSAYAIEAAVTEAGFRISNRTVTRRLNALVEARKTRASARSNVFLEAFAAAYFNENAAGRGGQTPLDEETRIRVYLEGVVSEFERLFSSELPDLDEEEIENIRRLRDHCDTVLNGRPVLRLVENTA